MTLRRQRRRLRRRRHPLARRRPACATRARPAIPDRRSPPPAFTRSTRGPSTWWATCPPSAPRRSRSTWSSRSTRRSIRAARSARPQDHVRPHRRRLGRCRDGVDGRRRHRARPARPTVFGKAGTYTLATRVRDNAGNESDWVDPHDHGQHWSDRGHGRAGRHDRRPDELAARAVHARRDRRRRGGTERRQRRVARRRQRIRAAARRHRCTFATDGVHDIETRAIDAAGNASAWRAHDVKVDMTQPGRHDRAAGGLDQHAHRHAERDRRDVRRRARSNTTSTAAHAPRTVVRADGTASRSPPTARSRSRHRVLDAARPASGGRPTPSGSTPCCRPTRAPPRRRRGRRARSRSRWPAPTRSPASITPSGASTAATSRPARPRWSRPRARRRSRRGSSTRPATLSAWGPETVKVDRPSRSTRRRRRPRPGARRTSPRPSPAPTRPGLGRAARRVQARRRLRRSTAPAVSITAEGSHTLVTPRARHRRQRLRLARRHGRHRQDRPDAVGRTAAATPGARRRPSAPSAPPAACPAWRR